MKGISPPQIPSRASSTPPRTPRLRRICRIPAISYHFPIELGVMWSPRELPQSPTRRGARYSAEPGGIVADVDTRRLVPRTDLLLADPRLAAAELRLGRPLVKAAIARAQQRA